MKKSCCQKVMGGYDRSQRKAAVGRRLTKSGHAPSRVSKANMVNGYSLHSYYTISHNSDDEQVLVKLCSLLDAEDNKNYIKDQRS